MKSMEVKRGAQIIPLPLKEGGTRAAILGLVKNRVDDKLEYLLTGLKLNIADALFEEMSTLTEESALAHHFNIMREMKVSEDIYREVFDELNNQLWLSFFSELDDSHIATPEGRIADSMKSFSRRVENHYKVLIKETTCRFRTLLKRDIDSHPLMPEYIYRCFWQATASLNLTYRERSFVLPLFHRFVMDRYGQILAAANYTLIELKVDVTIQPTSSQ